MSLSVASVDGNKEVVASSSSKQVDMADVSYVEGTLRIAPKGFGFVEDTFVPPFVIGNFKNETKVRAPASRVGTNLKLATTGKRLS
jgi:hypothetical protein